MTAVLAIVNLVGWRGAAGIAVGAALAMVPAYQLGVFREAAAAEERTARVLAERDIRQMEIENARVDAAAAARLNAVRGGDDGGMPDDGFRRD